MPAWTAPATNPLGEVTVPLGIAFIGKIYHNA
jgi:hypothetical protein